METFFLKSEDIGLLYDTIACTYNLFVPSRITVPQRVMCEHGYILPSDDYLMKQYVPGPETVVFNEYRCIEPTRAFFTRFKETVGEYFTQTRPLPPDRDTGKPVAVAGVKSCDLFALKIQDYVFLEGVEADPLYQARRGSGLVISGDCPSFKETCFCRALGIDPFAVEGFDLNLSPLSDGYLVDAATPKGTTILKTVGSAARHATVGQISGRQAKREATVARLDTHLAQHRIPPKDKLREIVTAGHDSKIWQEQMRTCVECGGCVMMCDTCHCFLLADEPHGRENRRERVWDGCLYKNFARVAGGASPLKTRAARLRNRYLKKFDFFVENLGIQACCGCGRCIDVCPGHIDIRHILRTLHEEHISAD